MVILVTGANGQLGKSIQKLAIDFPSFHFVFADSATLDITNSEKCAAFFENIKPDFCINAAAYTAVDKAENESEIAHSVNVIGTQNLVANCKKHNTTLIHISTDFVFDGQKSSPYFETDATHPINVYGKTKLDGEKVITTELEKYYIIRTSWLYSEFGHNFYKTMLRLAQEKSSLNVVSDQVGTPTHATCLSAAILEIITKTAQLQNYGIYHFSNLGQCSWYDFAKEIFEVNKIKITLNPIPTSSYPTAATRPKYSVLDKTKIMTTFGIKIKTWQQALKDHNL